MKTTIDIPDSLYPVILAASAARGVSVEAFVVNAATVAADGPTMTNPIERDSPAGLMSVFGIADHEEVRDVQRIIDEEFSNVDPRDWE
jgi:hypothetical protein